MSILVLFAAPCLAGLVLVIVGVLVVTGVLGVERTGLHVGAQVARCVGSLLGVVVGTGFLVLGVGGQSSPGPLGYGAIATLGPGIGAAVLVLAITIGERTFSAPHVNVRSASLVRRTTGTVVPRSALLIGIASLVMLAILSLLGTALSDGGRAYTAVRHLPTGEVTRSGATPFPGHHYTLPMWGGILVLLLCSALAIRAILLRRPSDDTRDILLRRRSSTSVIGAVVLAAAASMLPVASLIIARLLTSDGLARTTTTEQVCIAVAAIGVVTGLVALPVGFVMVVFPEVLARYSSVPSARTPEPSAPSATSTPARGGH